MTGFPTWSTGSRHCPTASWRPWERHLSYPVLHYFHSAERHVDLRTQAQLLDEAVTLLRHAVAEDVRPHPVVLDGL